MDFINLTYLSYFGVQGRENIIVVKPKARQQYILDDVDKCLSKCLLVLAFQFAILVWIPSFCRSVCHSIVTVVQNYMKYICLLLGPSPPMSCSLSEELVVSRVNWCIFEEERSVKRWATFYLDLHYIMHTIYSSGSQTI